MEKDIASEKFLKKLGLCLRSIRLKKGWTLEQTEEHGWPSWRHLQKIESGKNITVQTLWKLSRVYKINLSEVFNSIEKN